MKKGEYYKNPFFSDCSSLLEKFVHALSPAVYCFFVSTSNEIFMKIAFHEKAAAKKIYCNFVKITFVQDFFMC